MVEKELRERSFKLSDGFNFSIDCDLITKEILTYIEFYEIYSELRLEPFTAHKVSKILTETAIVVVYKTLEGNNYDRGPYENKEFRFSNGEEVM